MLEMMIAIAVGSFVVLGIYSIYSVSMRTYRLQDQTVEAIAHLRTGMSQLKTDLRSTAFNAPAQSDKEDWVFVVGANPIFAFSIEVDQDLPVANPVANININPQRVTLTGDFEGHQTFTTSAVNGQEITLQWSPENGTEADFNRIFSKDHMLRIELYGQARQEQVIPINSADYRGGLNPTVRVAAPVQSMQGFGSGHEVGVLSTVRYRLVRDTKRDKESVKYDLIREKIDRFGLPVVGSWLVVAEYVVDMQFYDFCFNTTNPSSGTMEQTPIFHVCHATLADLKASAQHLDPKGTNDSHLLRSVSFKLSVRSPFEDAVVRHTPRASLNAPLKTYELDIQAEGAARVVESAAMVFLAGIQARRQ